ncbi:MAG: ABC transporter permease [Hyphomicrobiales bacterium]|nr:MAG: ABC transporter permease [Hyphomicrobiales bacterium]
MGQQLAYRLMLSVPVLLGVLVFGFLLIKLAPGDPAMVIAGPTATPDVVEKIRQEMGLDQPAIVQFWRYMSRVAHGDLGKSMINNTSVFAELTSAVGATAELMVACLIWAVPVGIAIGTIAAVNQRGILDRGIMALSVAGVSMPVFFIGLLLLQYIGYKWQLLPFLGRGGPLWTPDGLAHVVLPALTLGFVFVGPVARMTRASVLDVLKADYVRTARAKGLRESSVIIRHALRNALIPIVTLVGLQAGYLLGGAVVTESIYSWPGVGRLAVGAILASDLPLAQGAILVLALCFVLINLIVDILYGILDPRVNRS